MRRTAERSLLGLFLMLSASAMTVGVSHAQEASGSPVESVPPKAAPHPKKPKPAPKSPEAAKASPATKGQAAVGQAAGGGASPAEVFRFGTWAVSCAKKAAPTEPANCLGLISVARDKQDQRKIVIMGLIKRNGTMTFFAQTPTAVELKSGVDVQFEGKAPRHFDYGSCEPALCTVLVPLDDALLNELVAAPSVTMLWNSLEAGQVKVVFSPAGAREAFEYLRAQQ